MNAAASPVAPTILTAALRRLDPTPDWFYRWALRRAVYAPSPTSLREHEAEALRDGDVERAAVIAEALTLRTAASVEELMRVYWPTA